MRSLMIEKNERYTDVLVSASRETIIHIRSEQNRRKWVVSLQTKRIVSSADEKNNESDEIADLLQIALRLTGGTRLRLSLKLPPTELILLQGSPTPCWTWSRYSLCFSCLQKSEEIFNLWYCCSGWMESRVRRGKKTGVPSFQPLSSYQRFHSLLSREKAWKGVYPWIASEEAVWTDLTCSKLEVDFLSMIYSLKFRVVR